MTGPGRVLILGLPYFGNVLARQLSERGWHARYRTHPGRDPRGWASLLPQLARADVVYLIGSRLDRRSPQDLLMRLRRRPVVIHWVGTDVLIAREEHERRNVSARTAEAAIHWCDAPWLVDELREMGMQSAYVPLPVPLPRDEPSPLPERFRVLLYLPVDAFDREVFDMDTLLRLPHEFPDVDFTVLPSPAETLPGPLPANVEARAWVDDMEALYKEITVYVRLTSHDGMSFMALESLARGRYVIWTHPLDGAIQASGFEGVARELGALHERHRRGDLPLNTSGRETTLEHFVEQQALDDIEARLRALL
jgi:hypothetical protein